AEGAVGPAAVQEVIPPRVEVVTAARPFAHDGRQRRQVAVVGSGSADEDVVAAAEQLVGAAAADDHVAAGAAAQDVGVGIADQQVVADAAGDVFDAANGAGHARGLAQRQVHDEVALYAE